MQTSHLLTGEITNFCLGTRGLLVIGAGFFSIERHQILGFLSLMFSESLIALTPVKNFFWTPGSAGGFFGSLLLLTASYFVEVALPIKDAPWKRKILFVLMGIIAGAALYYIREKEDKAEMLYAMMVGAGWPYVALALFSGGKIIARGFVGFAREVTKEIEVGSPTTTTTDAPDPPEK